MKKFAFVFFISYSAVLLIYAIVTFSLFEAKASFNMPPFVVACSIWSYLFAKEYARPMTRSENASFSLFAVVLAMISASIFLGGFLVVGHEHKSIAPIIALFKSISVTYWVVGFAVAFIIYYISAFVSFAVFSKIFNKIIEKQHERLTSRSS